jgi:hypothetical protein
VIAEVLKEDFYSFGDMAKILKVSPSTLKQRIYNGSDHPPYKKIFNEYVFPTDEFRHWAISKPVLHEARGGKIYSH